MTALIAGGLAAFVVALAAPVVIRPLLERLGAHDVPTQRSLHSSSILRGGGLAPGVGLIVGLIVATVVGGYGASSLLPWLALAIAVVAGALGFVEDVRGIPVLWRAVCQLVIGGAAAALVATVFPVTVALLAGIAVFIAGYINVANFMDGVDGISSGHALVTGAAFVAWGTLTATPWLVLIGVLCAAAFIAFLPWNFLGRKLFLGDVGSYLLGGLVGVTVVMAVVSGIPLIVGIGPLLVYLVDTSVTLVRRVVTGEKWYQSHRSHVYQRLTDFGVPHLAVAGVVTGLSAIAAIAGIVGGSAGWLGILATCSVYVIIATIYLLLPTFLRRGSSRAR